MFWPRGDRQDHPGWSKKKAVPGVGKARLADIARGAGIARAYELQTLADLERSLADILQEPGPTVVDLHVGPRLMPMSGSYPQPIRALRERYLKVLNEASPTQRS